MYNAFRLLEKGFFVLSLLGLVLRSAFVSVGIPMLLIGLASLAVLYFMGGYFQARLPESAGLVGPAGPIGSGPRKLPGLRIVSGIALSVLVIGVLFRLLAWQGSTVEIVAGLVLGAGVQLWAFVAGRGPGQPVATSVFRRTALLMAIGGFVLLTPVSSIIRWFHRNDTALADKMVYQHEHPDDPAAAQAVRQHLQAKPQQL